MPSLRPTLRVWEDVLVQLRRTSVSWQGNSLSERDLNTFTEALVMCSLHLTDMSNRHGGIGTQREIIAWARNCASLDVHVLGSFLSDVVTLLRHVAEPTTYGWFKRQLSSTYPFVGAYCSPIRGALQDFLECPSADGFYVCYQFFSFLTHLTLLDINVDLEDEYEELESYLQSLQYPKHMVSDMNKIMREWLSEFTLNEMNFRPQHGPGAVAELPATATLIEKYRHLGDDPLISYVFTKFAGVDVTSYFALPKTGSWGEGPSNDGFEPLYPSWERQSKLVSVPKSLKTRRTISKEPATLMFLQQGVAKALMDFLHGHPYLSGHIDLRRQWMNARLAISSSRSHRFATIDLSSASDTVTTTLVKAVFYGTPLYPYLVALRSQTVRLPSGKVLRTEKFAPMGSALCFPIETLIFSCAVEYAVRRAHRTFLGSYPEWRVYGDDIIVREPLFQDVLLVLGALGFIINESKSFDSCARFRESCGGEGYDGVDVTPLRISRRFQSVRGRITSRHAAVYEGLVEMANSCHIYKFSLLRAWIIQVLLGYPHGSPLFSETGRGALYSPMPDNYRAPQRVNFDLQRSEIQVVASRTAPLKEDVAPDLELARYVETLRQISLRKGGVFYPDDKIQVLRGTRPARLRNVWVENPTQSFACLGLLNSL